MKYIVLLILILTCTESFAQKITALTEDTSPTTDDLTVIVNDPAGTPTTKKATLANIFKSHNIYTDGTNVGISTLLPVAKLHVNGTTLLGSTTMPSGASASLVAVGNGSNRAFEQFNAGSDTTGMLVWGGTTASTGNAIRLRGNSSNGGASYIFTDFATTEGDLVFGTYSNRTKQLYLSKTGNVGIGTWAPSAPLEITKDFNGQNTLLKLKSPNGYANSSIDIDFILTTSNTLARIGALRTNRVVNGDTGLVFSTFSNSSLSERMRLQDDGNVGIGTTTPAGALTIMNGNVGIGTWVPSSPMTIKTGTTITTKQSAANQACSTTCGNFSCYLGQDTGTNVIVDCADATADVCICSK